MVIATEICPGHFLASSSRMYVAIRIAFYIVAIFFGIGNSVLDVRRIRGRELYRLRCVSLTL